MPPVPPTITTFGGDLKDVRMRAFDERIALHIFRNLILLRRQQTTTSKALERIHFFLSQTVVSDSFTTLYSTSQREMI